MMLIQSRLKTLSCKSMYPGTTIVALKIDGAITFCLWEGILHFFQCTWITIINSMIYISQFTPTTPRPLKPFLPCSKKSPHRTLRRDGQLLQKQLLCQAVTQVEYISKGRGQNYVTNVSGSDFAYLYSTILGYHKPIDEICMLSCSSLLSEWNMK